MCAVVMVPKSGEPIIALRSTVSILRTPSFRPKWASVPLRLQPIQNKLKILPSNAAPSVIARQ
jgi:hypothetical protein